MFGWLRARIFLQLLAIVPGTRGARSGHVREQSVELGAQRGGELAAVLQQHPTQALQARIELLLGPAHLADRLGCMGDDVEFFEGDLGVRKVICDAADQGRPHVHAGQLDFVGFAAVRAEILRKGRDGGLGVSEILRVTA